MSDFKILASANPHTENESEDIIGSSEVLTGCPPYSRGTGIERICDGQAGHDMAGGERWEGGRQGGRRVERGREGGSKGERGHAERAFYVVAVFSIKAGTHVDAAL